MKNPSLEEDDLRDHHVDEGPGEYFDFWFGWPRYGGAIVKLGLFDCYSDAFYKAEELGKEFVWIFSATDFAHKIDEVSTLLEQEAKEP